MDASSLLTPSILLFLLSFAVYYFTARRKKDMKKKTPSGAKIDLSQIVKNGHRFLDWTADLVLASPTNTVTMFSCVVTANPTNIEHVLKTHFDNYPKGDHLTAGLVDLLGRGIFNTDGEHWRLQRKTASLEFSAKTLRAFSMDNVRREVIGRLLPLLSRSAAAGEVFDLQDVLDRLAFDSVCKVAFDVDPAFLLADGREDCGRFARAFEAAAGISLQRYQKPGFLWRIGRALNVGSERRLKAELATVNEFAMRVVREMKRKRQESKGGGSDLLSRFITEADYSDEFLRDVVISFVLAGRDTTSTTMAWFFWAVSSRPEVRQKIRDEIDAVRSQHGSSGGTAFTMEELREMEYLHAALTETLRLYPTVPLHARSCREDDVLPDGTAVRKGWSVMHNVYAMGRMESIWGADCEEYRPERWLQEGGFRPKNPFRFPVFLAGPRTCLGKEMAYIQMKAVAASVLEVFEVEVAEEGKRDHEVTIVLRMKGGLPVRVSAREEGKGSSDVATAPM